MVESRVEVEEGEDVEAGKALIDRMRIDEEMDDLKVSKVDAELSSDGNQDVGHGSLSKHREKASSSEKHRSKERRKERRVEKERGSEDKERTGTHSDMKGRDKDSHHYELREKDRAYDRDRRREDKDEHRKEREREKDNGKENMREKDYDYDKYREKDWERERDRNRDRDRDRDVKKDTERARDRLREREKDRERDRDREREHDRSKVQDRELEKERLREKDLDREKDRERDRERGRDRDRGKDREKGKDKAKDRERDRDRERIAEYERDKLGRDKDRDKLRDKDRGKESVKEKEQDEKDGKNRDKVSDKEISGVGEMDLNGELRGYSSADYENEDGDYDKSSEKHGRIKIDASNRPESSTKEIEDRIMKMKEERMKNTEGVSEVSAWVSRIRKLEEKKLQSERKKAQQWAKVFEEQDMIDQEDSEDERVSIHSKDLAGVKILHGLDKVVEGGAVVLTLKDQNILANGDINDEADMLVNVEIGEQKQRDEAYKAAKKKTGIYDDKFNDDGSQKAVLPQYDDAVQDEGVVLDEGGRFTAEAEKKLEELRRRLQGSATSSKAEDLTTPGKFSTDYYTQEEMLQFKRPKKKKSLRKKERLDLDAMEAEAISAGLGAADLGTRDEARRQSAKEAKERLEAEMRNNAYQLAAAKAEEASKALRMQQAVTIKSEEDENAVFGDDDDLSKSIKEARKLALKKQEAIAASGPQAVASLATLNNQSAHDQKDAAAEDRGEKKIIFTEMNEFIWKLQLNSENNMSEPKDVFAEKEVVPESVVEEMEMEVGGWTEVKENGKDDSVINEETADIAPGTTILEPSVGKGLSGALQLLQQRGTLKESVDWGGRNMDKKKSKLVGVVDNDGTKEKEIRIERTDEFGRILTPKEAFRVISHKFHGKGPGKMKLEKRIKQHQEDLKLKQMKASDTPLLSMEKMREAQARLQSPYLVLSGHVKPGQSSDPRSGFATIEKEQPGSLTPMLGDKKVEAFLGIKRKAEPSNLGPPKKPKTE